MLTRWHPSHHISAASDGLGHTAAVGDFGKPARSDVFAVIASPVAFTYRPPNLTGNRPTVHDHSLTDAVFPVDSRYSCVCGEESRR